MALFDNLIPTNMQPALFVNDIINAISRNVWVRSVVRNCLPIFLKKRQQQQKCQQKLKQNKTPTNTSKANLTVRHERK